MFDRERHSMRFNIVLVKHKNMNDVCVESQQIGTFCSLPLTNIIIRKMMVERKNHRWTMELARAAQQGMPCAWQFQLFACKLV